MSAPSTPQGGAGRRGYATSNFVNDPRVPWGNISALHLRREIKEESIPRYIWTIDDESTDVHEDGFSINEEAGGWRIKTVASPYCRDATWDRQKLRTQGSGFEVPKAKSSYCLHRDGKRIYVAEFWTDGTTAADAKIGIGDLRPSSVRNKPDKETCGMLEDLMGVRSPEAYAETMVLSRNLLFASYAVQHLPWSIFFNEQEFVGFFSTSPRGNAQYGVEAYTRASSPVRRHDDRMVEYIMRGGNVSATDVSEYAEYLNEERSGEWAREQHIIEGFMTIVDRADEAMNILLRNISHQKMQERVMKRFHLSFQQTQAIVSRKDNPQSLEAALDMNALKERHALLGFRIRRQEELLAA